MHKNKLRFCNFIICITSIGMSMLSAQDCVDDASGAYTSVGGCSAVLGSMQQTCDATFMSVLVGTECPITCDMCPGTCGDGIYDWDENGVNCPQDVPGCDLPDKSLSIRANGNVLFKSSEIIGGFQCYVEGGTVDSANGGIAGSSGLDVQTSPASGKVLAFSMTGNTIAVGCGILTKLHMTGTPTGINDGTDNANFTCSSGSGCNIVISSPAGTDLNFSYEESLSFFQYSSNLSNGFSNSFF